MDFLTEYEKSTGFVARTQDLVPTVENEQEYRDYIGEHPTDFIHVLIEQREAFLTANNYDVTRETLINADLADQITPEPDNTVGIVEQLKELDQANENGTEPAQEV